MSFTTNNCQALNNLHTHCWTPKYTCLGNLFHKFNLTDQHIMHGHVILMDQQMKQQNIDTQMMSRRNIAKVLFLLDPKEIATKMSSRMQGSFLDQQQRLLLLQVTSDCWWTKMLKLLTRARYILSRVSRARACVF